MHDLALVNMDLGNKAAALSMAKRAIPTDPIEEDVVDGPASIEILARVAAQTGELDRAIAGLQKLLSIPYEGALPWPTAPLTAALLELDPMFETHPQMISASKNPSSRHERSIKLTHCYTKRAHSTTHKTAPISYLVRAAVARVTALFHNRRMFAAFPSCDCRLGHPKVKLFALKCSPNVPRPPTSHSPPKPMQNISPTLSSAARDVTTAVSLVSYRPEQTGLTPN